MITALLGIAAVAVSARFLMLDRSPAQRPGPTPPATPSPQELVPRAALGGLIQIDQFAGRLLVKMPKFKSWLEAGGARAQLVALQDARAFDALTSGSGSASTAEAVASDGPGSSPGSIPQNEVRDIAFQLLCRGQGLDPISYRYDRARRNEHIQELIRRLQAAK